MLSDVLQPFLITRAAITAEVKASNIQKWPIDLEIKDYSILAFRQTGNTQEQTFNKSLPGLATETVSFICIGKSPVNALNLAKAVELDLRGFVGNIGDVNIQKVEVISVSDEYEPETGAHVALLSLNFITRGINQ